MNRLRMLRRLALLGTGVTSACGGRMAEDVVGGADTATTVEIPLSDAGSGTDTLDVLADASVVADTHDVLTVPMRCVGSPGGDAGVCAPGSYCWSSGSNVYCSRDMPETGDAGARCGDGWCGGSGYGSSWCELRETEAICHVPTYSGAGGPHAPPELLA